MDWQEASAELTKKLDPANVKGRQQGGGQVQYIEGWHAIAEMNRIFGFGEWTRETLELRQLGEPRDVNGKIRVDYMARVRISVGGVIRDGSGFGQGIDKDVGQAHESGLKEAETDAMKRAMMTFGNPFGLALYDKSRENVGREETGPDWVSIRDNMLAAVNGRDTQASALKLVLDDKRFQSEFRAMSAADKPKSLEVRSAIEKAWLKAHGGQFPEHPFIDELSFERKDAA